MNCIEFKTALEQAIESRTPMASSATEHSASCAECRIEWENQCRLDSMIAVWKPVQPPSGLIDAVLAELAVSNVMRTPVEVVTTDLRTKSPSARFAVVAAAACLLIAIVFGARDFGKTSDALTNKSRIHHADSTVTDDSLNVAESLTAVFSDLRSEYHSLAGETTSAARDIANAIPHRVTVPSLPISHEFESQPISGNVTRIWNPIGSRVESALGFLRQAVPNEFPSG